MRIYRRGNRTPLRGPTQNFRKSRRPPDPVAPRCYSLEMRAGLALLLCFSVAFQGTVGARAFPTPCPMEHGAAPVALSPSESTPSESTRSQSPQHSNEAVPDCCNDADTAATTGELCKTDSPCGPSSACVLPSVPADVYVARDTNPVRALTASIAAFDPSSVWRPPSLS